ncbi:amino acid adenylation domain-containing protein [Streptomyces lavendulocolor]|uniref:amino acid adenylation domain-containing protein n=1 Tax=Streptomyces lavendulocolor TaxID=67316 RepID=UPI003C2BCD29
MTDDHLHDPSAAGRLCRAVALRVHTGADPERLGRALTLLTGTAGARLWVEDVPDGAESPAAAHARERELTRPTDPATGPGLRAVLLRYADGGADLVVVAHRAVPADPYELARALLDPAARPTDPVTAAHDAAGRLGEQVARLDRAPAPDWGLGEPGTAGAGSRPFTLPVHGDAPAAVTAAAALGLVLARCTGGPDVELGTGPGHSLVFTADATPTVGEYLERVRHAEPVPSRAPAAGLYVTEPAEVLTGEGLKAEVIEDRPFLAPLHPLSVHVTDDGSTVLSGVCHHRRSAFGDSAVEWLTGMLVTAHRALVTARPDTPLADVPLLDDDQRHRLAVLGGLGRTPAAPEAAGERIEQTVRSWAERTPDATALTFEGTEMTYRQLDERAERIAGALRALGVAPADRVGVCLDRTADLVVILLGVLKTGAAYVPMDPAYPADRLAYMTEDAELSLVVTESDAFPAADGVRTVHPGSLAAADPDGKAPEPKPLSADAAAYVIYTSGSTGRPKGVVVPHRNVAALMDATRADFGLGGRDVWTLFHSSAFDFSVWEIWGCLTTGGRLVVVPYWASRDPERFARLLGEERVTVLSQTPSAFAQLMEADRAEPVTDSVRLVVFGGEPLDTRPLLSWLDRHPASRCRLVNMFGITETTVHVTAQTVTRREALTGSRSVGHPLPGWHLYVLDPEGRELPPGVAGEIHVGGAGVAGQYLNRPELTAQRFVPDPHAPGPMYRSGDRGRLLPDGRLEHLGRLDNQVKLRGFRIELDEIRARLLDAPGVAAAAVVLRQKPGDAAGARLDAYVVLRGGDGAPGPDGTAPAAGTEEVRRHAARFLPEHMVPSTVTALPALPLTPNGKIDTSRLPEPLAGVRTTPAAADEEAGDLETRLRGVWEKVFGFRVGPDDDFFTLGGNSLLAVRLLAALREAAMPVFPLPQLYLHRTVRTLAAHLAGAEARA